MLSILLMVKQCKASLTCAINFARIKDITSSSLGIICFFGTITDLVTKRFCTLFPSLVVVMTQIQYKWYSYLHLKNHVERFLCALFFMTHLISVYALIFCIDLIHAFHRFMMSSGSISSQPNFLKHISLYNNFVVITTVDASPSMS